MHGITALLLTEYDEAAILERVDDWCTACGNKAVTHQVLSEVMTPYSDTLDDIDILTIKHELAEAWCLQL